MKTFDIFISHASEDKDSVAKPIAEALARLGVNVWYDEFNLKLGDSLSRSIDVGLERSKYGLVVLSPAFFAKNWPEYELKGLVAKEMGGSKVILPIWHNVDRAGVLKYSPTLADKLAVRTDFHSMDEIALQIVDVIRPDIYQRIIKRQGANQSSCFSRGLQQNIEGLYISSQIRQSLHAVLTHPEYPRWMSISGNIVKNPIWEAIPARTRRQIISKYRIDGPSAPQAMHLDMMLIRCNDHQGHGQIYTYFSPDWETNLITFRPWLPEDNPDHRQEMNAAQLAKYLPVSAKSIAVTPMHGKYAVSVKPHAKYHDLIVYVYELGAVLFGQGFRHYAALATSSASSASP